MKMIAVKKGIIANWKSDTPEENELALLADTSEEAKVQYCEYYRALDEKYYNKGVEMARKLIKERGASIQGITEDALIRDMFYALHRFGHSLEEYFDYKLYEKTPFGKDEYISDKMRFEYYYEMNSEEGIALLNDKGRTNEVFKKYYKRDVIAVRSEDDKQAFEAFVSNHPRFICKPNNESGGKGVHIEELGDSTVSELFDKLLAGGKFIAEEIICQCEKMASLHPASLNTVRIPTLRCKDGVHIFHPVLRMGRGGSTADNAGVGGIRAAVDADTGILKTMAVNISDKTYVRHPDTNTIIPGFELPCWDEAIALVKELAMVLPDMRYTGWDLAHTDNGWVLVEANGCGQFVAQKPEKTGMKRELLALMANM